jgi:hypothetical protein
MDVLSALQKGDKSVLIELIAKLPAETLQTSLDEILFQAAGLGASEDLLDVLVEKGKDNKD